MKRSLTVFLIILGVCLAVGTILASGSSRSPVCIWCHGTGLTSCLECLGSNGLPTGMARCDTCKGAGKVACPRCNGNWKSNCNYCNATGKIVIGWESRGGQARYAVMRDCDNCQGRGYAILCTECTEGRIRCTVCNGKGRDRFCPKCMGEKKVPCPHCAIAAAATAGPATRAATPAPAAAPVTGLPMPALPPAGGDPLKSLDDMVAHLMRRHPHGPQPDQDQWNRMTTLQQQESLRKYRQDLSQWRSTEFQDRKVNWQVILDDITPVLDGTFLVKTSSAGGFTLNWSAPASAKEQLLKFSRKDRLQVAGTVKDYRFRESESGRLFDVGQMSFEVELREATILSDGAAPARLETSSQPSPVSR